MKINYLVTAFLTSYILLFPATFAQSKSKGYAMRNGIYVITENRPKGRESAHKWRIKWVSRGICTYYVVRDLIKDVSKLKRKNELDLQNLKSNPQSKAYIYAKRLDGWYVAQLEQLNKMQPILQERFSLINRTGAERNTRIQEMHEELRKLGRQFYNIYRSKPKKDSRK